LVFLASRSNDDEEVVVRLVMIGIHVSFSVGGSHLSKLLLRSKLLANRPLISAPIDHTSGEYYLDPMQASSVVLLEAPHNISTCKTCKTHRVMRDDDDG
jgi:hypothetical protein